MDNSHPAVLCFSGHDPSGGAGIQADIETLASHHCHPCSVVTALTEQDSRNVYKLVPQHPDDIYTQAKCILEDMAVQAIKIGLIGDHHIAHSIATILKENPHIPVVLDPVLAAGGGTALSTDKLIDTMITTLLPLTSILTPNSNEAKTLAAKENIDHCAFKLMDKGCQYVLITGTHLETANVVNRFYHQNHCLETFTWNRLPNSYHGSGCTLASSIAALIAHGLEPLTAVFEAQEYTWNTLNEACHPGKGQYIPNRFFWMQDN